MNDKNTVSQMVAGIIGNDPDKNATEEEKRKFERMKTALSARASEYLMFMDDDDSE